MADSVKLTERKRSTTKCKIKFLQEGDGKEKSSQVQKKKNKENKYRISSKRIRKNDVRRNCNMEEKEPSLRQQANCVSFVESHQTLSLR